MIKKMGSAWQTEAKLLEGYIKPPIAPHQVKDGRYSEAVKNASCAMLYGVIEKHNKLLVRNAVLKRKISETVAATRKIRQEAKRVIKSQKLGESCRSFISVCKESAETGVGFFESAKKLGLDGDGIWRHVAICPRCRDIHSKCRDIVAIKYEEEFMAIAMKDADGPDEIADKRVKLDALKFILGGRLKKIYGKDKDSSETGNKVPVTINLGCQLGGGSGNLKTYSSVDDVDDGQPKEMHFNESLKFLEDAPMVDKDAEPMPAGEREPMDGLAAVFSELEPREIDDITLS